jgi:uncharacterized protein (TIGR02246 family)
VVPVNAPTSTDPTSTDEQQVHAVLRTAYEAWGAGDADAFAALYTADATSALPGSLRRGRVEIREYMAAAFAGPLRGSTVDDTPVSTRFPTPDTAVVVSEGAVRLAGETEVPAQRWVRASWLLVRVEGRWLISAYHNCALHR